MNSASKIIDSYHFAASTGTWSMASTRVQVAQATRDLKSSLRPGFHRDDGAVA